MSTLSDRLLFQYRTDPLGKKDSYAGLTAHEKAELFSTDDGTTLATKALTPRRPSPPIRR